MSNILAIDTSGDACTAAVSRDEQFFHLSAYETKSHANSLLRLIDEVLELAELSLNSLAALAVVSGPGSFTGLRIGIGVVQGLAFSLNKPVILLSSMELLASTAARSSHCAGLIVLLKSNKNEVYFACYRVIHGQTVELIGNEQVCEPGNLTLPAGAEEILSWQAIGNGWEYGEVASNALGINPPILSDVEVDASKVFLDLAKARFNEGKFVSAEQALPNYVKVNLDYVKSS